MPNRLPSRVTVEIKTCPGQRLARLELRHTSPQERSPTVTKDKHKPPATDIPCPSGEP